MQAIVFDKDINLQTDTLHIFRSYYFNNAYVGPLDPKYRIETSFTKERLDRVVVNPSRAECYKESFVEILAASRKRLQKKNFKYENSWSLGEECGRVIEVQWKKETSSTEPLKRVQEMMEWCRKALASWSNETFVFLKKGEDDKREKRGVETITVKGRTRKY